ncbi:sodium:proton antiporter NhaD [Paracrocinitomix mangrovi]|uniref:sodium:proton antiporter NhaD n=1 Tax=Paracrocinitomix mangrovi TaxID=2862509 RepID=UPI001EDA83FC|nr:sodium:proton antiporter NhaD [Paracrocinitomix mangrovi]UKN03215.1 sodium:proton antiporter NhaD [Paracrocinitomix mangrovi]
MGLEFVMVIIFVVGYAAIALEHNIKVDKAASALLIGMICWGMYALWPEQHLGVQEGQSIVDVSRDTTIQAHNPSFAEFANHEVIKERDEILNHGNYDMEMTTKDPHHTSHHVHEYVEHGLTHHLFEIAGILFFLLGAMTIVELIDAHEGFSVITDRISTTSKVKLLWVICLLTFFMSAALDNLTTSIVMISVIRKLIDSKETRWLFGGFIIIAANAGGAWSPIGDVTTTMLWNNGQLPHTDVIITNLIIPSLTALIVPLILASIFVKGQVQRPDKSNPVSAHGHAEVEVTNFEKTFVFFLGLAGLLFVPVFKTMTHLPPFTGMMLSLGVLWAVTEVMHGRKSSELKRNLSVISVLQKVDTASVLFFLGILMAVAALQEVGHLNEVAGFLNDKMDGNIYTINVSIGLLSAIVDNVPLVAAAQGMYPIADVGDFAIDGKFWQFLAYCAGTGGSALIIGSAAGVAVMGLEKISFGWYLKKISLYAIIGYASGAAVYWLMFH